LLEADQEAGRLQLSREQFRRKKEQKQNIQKRQKQLDERTISGIIDIRPGRRYRVAHIPTVSATADFNTFKLRNKEF